MCSPEQGYYQSEKPKEAKVGDIRYGRYRCPRCFTEQTLASKLTEVGWIDITKYCTCNIKTPKVELS